MNCFKIKGDYEVCPYCGYIEGDRQESGFQLKPGTILKDRYIIGEALGYGGFGITYRAFDTILGKIIAIKEFYPTGLVNRAEGETKVGIFSGNKAVEYQRLLGRFIEEARNMALFDSEKDIVNVFTYFEENGTAYIIMEYIDGILLKQYLKEHGKIQEKQACDYICAVLTAVQKIHDKGIIHKDISPDNIFLTEDGGIKIFDFGAARLQQGEIEQNGVAVVKPGYTPPEQYRTASHQDYRMDIYAVGAILYQMLTGECPLEALDRVRQDRLQTPFGLQTPSERGIPVSPHIEKAMMKALSLKVEERFSSAEEFRQALLAPEGKKNQTEKRHRWGWL